MELILLSVGLGLSIILNVSLVVYILRKRKIPEKTLDAKELLSDLLSTGAVVRIDRIDPQSIFLRRY